MNHKLGSTDNPKIMPMMAEEPVVPIIKSRFVKMDCCGKATPDCVLNCFVLSCCCDCDCCDCCCCCGGIGLSGYRKVVVSLLVERSISCKSPTVRISLGSLSASISLMVGVVDSAGAVATVVEKDPG